ncbi:type II toxin-antitoxin system VapC family toxin [Deinococcus sp.]|uniref:type II toxin-antitoxin system VapC family toxin n=1 Tax=Deinococcus sp. TaxID=47478 RepID=UPI003C7D45C3
MSRVLDASAVLAWFFDEPGADRVDQALIRGAVIHTVNWAEVLSKLAERGLDPEEAEQDLGERGVLGQTLTVDVGHPGDARRVAALRPLTQGTGLSLGDRYCLALGLRLGWPVLTADRVWGALDVGVTVELIR